MTALFGEMTRVGSGFTLEFERVLDTDVDDLWSAVTDRERLGRWMAPITGDLLLGGVAWDDRYDALRTPWEERFGALRT